MPEIIIQALNGLQKDLLYIYGPDEQMVLEEQMGHQTGFLVTLIHTIL